ncbi:unnamed protein product [Allacma fusca]|uniref:C3H1-type domain-containing protein n=1 Tax=Allacma fusca TaxID=39272 RepID=A0A8J2JGR6_9HEXA|nr:unnamed protein product [Allacma fusca]
MGAYYKRDGELLEKLLLSRNFSGEVSEMFIENAESLRSWLTSVLQPLCDADPAALAKYVLALIKKDRPDQELKQSMIDQLDVFLQQETKGFVDLLFRTLANKSYIPEVSAATPVQDGEEKPNPTTVVASSVESSQLNTSKPSTTEDLPAGVSNPALAHASVNLYHTPAPIDSSPSAKAEVKIAKRESTRKDDEKDRDAIRHRKSRSPRRSPSRAHRIRSRSPRERDARDRDQYPHRSRHRVRKSPPRRYEREGWERRRSDRRSPNRNRSASPRARSRTPTRYRRNYHSRSRSRSRSPNRDRSRSPVREKVEKKDIIATTAMDTELPPAEPADSKTHLQSVVRAVNHVEKVDKVGYTTVGGNGSSDRCRDFDEKGLCMRGELCPFDHGKDPVVLEDISVSPRGTTGEFMGVGGANNVYAPQILRPTMPIISNPSMEPPLCWGGVPPPFRPRHMGGMRHRGPMARPPPIGFPIMPQRELINIPVTGACGDQMLDVRGPPPPGHHMGGIHRMRGGIHTNRGGRGRGGFDHGRLGMKPARNFANCSLEVKKIPRELNNIMDLNSHFLRFGKIVNIQINFENDPEAALITFSSPLEANLAYRSTEAVLNNRFIRVFWHNKEKENEEGEGTSESGTTRVSVKDRLGMPEGPDEKVEQEKILVSGNNLTKTVYNPGLLAKKAETAGDKIQAVEAIKKSQEALSTLEHQKKVKEESQRNARKLMVDLRKRKQDMLHEQIEQQKKLISKLELCKTKPEREGLMTLIKSLQESIEGIKKDLDTSKNQSPSIAPKIKEEAPGVKEILDAELDLINKEQEGGDTNALQKKVHELRAQAQAFGHFPRGGGRGGVNFRGLGRGFSAAARRGRGGGKRFRLLRKVDRRPTTICVTGFPAVKLKEILAQFASFGPIAYYDADPLVPAVTITYESRKKSEIAYTNGRKFENMVLNIEWVTPIASGADKKPDAAKNGQASNQDEENNGSMEEEEMSDIYADELLLQYEDEEEEDDDERSWRR